MLFSRLPYVFKMKKKRRVFEKCNSGSRLAGCLEHTHNFYSAEQAGKKVLPGLLQMLFDCETLRRTRGRKFHERRILIPVHSFVVSVGFDRLLIKRNCTMWRMTAMVIRYYIFVCSISVGTYLFWYRKLRCLTYFIRMKLKAYAKGWHSLSIRLKLKTEEIRKSLCRTRSLVELSVTDVWESNTYSMK